MLMAFDHAIEEVAGMQDRGIAIESNVLFIFTGWSREKQSVKGTTSGLARFCQFGFVLGSTLFDLDAGCVTTFQCFGSEWFWPAAWRITKLSRQKGDDRVWNVIVARVFFEVDRVSVGRYQC